MGQSISQFIYECDHYTESDMYYEQMSDLFKLQMMKNKIDKLSLNESYNSNNELIQTYTEGVKEFKDKALKTIGILVKKFINFLRRILGKLSEQEKMQYEIIRVIKKVGIFDNYVKKYNDLFHEFFKNLNFDVSYEQDVSSLELPVKKIFVDGIEEAKLKYWQLLLTNMTMTIDIDNDNRIIDLNVIRKLSNHYDITKEFTKIFTKTANIEINEKSLNKYIDALNKLYKDMTEDIYDEEDDNKIKIINEICNYITFTISVFNKIIEFRSKFIPMVYNDIAEDHDGTIGIPAIQNPLPAGVVLHFYSSYKFSSVGFKHSMIYKRGWSYYNTTNNKNNIINNLMEFNKPATRLIGKLPNTSIYIIYDDPDKHYQFVSVTKNEKHGDSEADMNPKNMYHVAYTFDKLNNTDDFKKMLSGSMSDSQITDILDSACLNDMRKKYDASKDPGNGWCLDQDNAHRLFDEIKFGQYLDNHTADEIINSEGLYIKTEENITKTTPRWFKYLKDNYKIRSVKSIGNNWYIVK